MLCLAGLSVKYRFIVMLLKRHDVVSPGRSSNRVARRTVLAAARFTALIVVLRGGARRRRVVLRAGHLHVHQAMNTWTAVSRSLGIAALPILAATLPVGLLFGRRLVARNRRADVRIVHMTLSLSGLAVAVLHVVTLPGATRLAPDVARLLVPGCGDTSRRQPLSGCCRSISLRCSAPRITGDAGSA
jgi:hypothetical protein